MLKKEKHQWRKHERSFYLPTAKPALVQIPTFRFVALSGEGSPSGEDFQARIAALYSLAYTVKMTLKTLGDKPSGYTDFTVYRLEGEWDINERAKLTFRGAPNPKDFVYRLMIRQPDFVDEALFHEMLALAKRKKAASPLLDELRFLRVNEGSCVHMLHVGKFEDEAQSFADMEAFAHEQGLQRRSKAHREIYLSDFRRTAPEKLKTVLRFQVL